MSRFNLRLTQIIIEADGSQTGLDEHGRVWWRRGRGEVWRADTMEAKVDDPELDH